MRLLINNISTLCNTENADSAIERRSGADMVHLPCIQNAWLLAENGIIHSMGVMNAKPEMHADETIDATGRMVLPAWVDSHTHLVFAAPRDGEFVAEATDF